jgi:hypothetical protein
MIRVARLCDRFAKGKGPAGVNPRGLRFNERDPTIYAPSLSALLATPLICTS